MLTATYSLVAISAEQKNSLTILEKLQHIVRACLDKIQGPDLGSLRTIFEKFAQFEHYLHTRKMVLYVIPAIRGANDEVDTLLAELEGMSARGMVLFDLAKEKLARTIARGESQLVDLGRTLEGYCDHLWQRLVKEETELLPMLGRCLTSDQWFPIATKFLSAEAGRRGRQGSATLPA